MVASGGMFRAAIGPFTGLVTLLRGSVFDPNRRGYEAWECSGSVKGRAVPVLVFHGDEDPFVDPDNGEQTVRQFAQTNDYGDDGIDNDSVPFAPTDIETGRAGPQGLRFTRRDYRYGGRLLVQYWEVHGLGHQWSGGDPDYPFAERRRPDETAVMWEFFRQHRR